MITLALILSLVIKCCFVFSLPSDSMHIDEEDGISQTTTISSDSYENQTRCEAQDGSYVRCETNTGDVANLTLFPFVDISDFQANCSEDNETLRDPATTTSDLQSHFQEAIESAMAFACVGNDSVAENAVRVLEGYVQKCTEFVTDWKEGVAEDTQALNVKLYEKNIADAKSVLYVVQELRNLTKDKDEMLPFQVSFAKNSRAFDHFNQTKVWDTIYREQSVLLDMMTVYVEKAANLSEYVKQNNLSKIFRTNTSSEIIGRKFWKGQLYTQREIVKLSKEAIDSFKSLDVLLFQVEPTVAIIVAIVSIIGNTFLLWIFIRHKEMRTLPNVMLINLTVIDFLSVVFGVFLDQLRLSLRWLIGLNACKAFFFVQYMSIGVCTYSVVMISIQRFLAVRDVPRTGRFELGNKAKAVLMTSTVWLVGSVTAISHAIAANVICDFCVEVRFPNFGTIAIIDFFTFCLIPVTLLCVFSALAGVHIKRSAKSMPGEGNAGIEKLKHDRVLASKVLFALVVLYFIGFVPHFLIMFINRGLRVRFGGWNLVLVNMIGFCLRNLNSCLNPVALYIMSNSYRKYFNMYIFCRK